MVNQYTWEHALGVAMYFNIFHKHFSSIGLATWAQLVNILAPILTDEEGSITQTVYYPMQYYRQHAGSINIPCSSSAPKLDNGIPSLHISATTNEQGDEIVLFAVNLNADKSLETKVTMDGGAKGIISQSIELNAPST